MITSDIGFWACSTARWSLVVSPPRERPSPWSSGSVKSHARTRGHPASCPRSPATSPTSNGHSRISVNGQSLDDLPLAKARFRTRAEGTVLNGLDLRIEFLPIVHISNTINDGDRFGQPPLAKIMQVLDELAEPTTRASRRQRPPPRLRGHLRRSGQPGHRLSR
ncbi:hypothetical protein [Streptomyces abikoensis]|uniref:hypothetical protein n=1 Tax=Streptomyces abikoensis TaxID=97398 RepID=UPI0033F5F126